MEKIEGGVKDSWAAGKGFSERLGWVRRRVE